VQTFCRYAYLSLSPPSKFRLMVATPWPCLFFATALYSPASGFATLSILSLARWYNFWSSSRDVLNRPPSFTSSVPWYLRSRECPSIFADFTLHRGRALKSAHCVCYFFCSVRSKLETNHRKETLLKAFSFDLNYASLMLYFSNNL